MKHSKKFTNRNVGNLYGKNFEEKHFDCNSNFVKIPESKNIEDIIISQTAGNLYWKSRDGKYLGCNEIFSKMIGLASPQDIIGKTDKELFLSNLGAKKLQAIIDLDQTIIQHGEEKTIEEIGLDKNGNIAYYITRKIPLKDENGNVIGLIGTSIDITDRKLAEEREKTALTKAAQAEVELREAVMVLAGSIAHDLRTPLAILAINTEILEQYWPIWIELYQLATAAGINLTSLEKRLPSPELLSKLNNCIIQMRHTTQEMREFITSTLNTLSKTLAKKLTPEDLSRCHMWHCLFNALERYPFAKDEKKYIHWNQGYDFEFMGHEVLMIRVLFNLVNNALEQIRFKKQGEIFISAEADSSTNILRIKDTAGGVPPEMLTTLFQGYQSNKEHGTGVGLAFCRLTMQSFGGDIEAHSIYGSFMEFILRFPKIIKTDKRGRRRGK